MNQQLTQLIRYTNIDEFQTTIQRMFNYEDITYEPKDLDFVFMNQLLESYLKLNDGNIVAWVKAERYLFQSGDFDKEKFFERQYLLLQKQLQIELQLYEILFQFKARMNGKYSIIFSLKSFEAFEQILKFQLKQQANHKPQRQTIAARKSQKTRSSNFGKLLFNAFNQKKKPINEQFQFMVEPIYSLIKINGLEFYQANQLEQFTQGEQQIIFNVSKDPKKMIENIVEQEILVQNENKKQIQEIPIKIIEEEGRQEYLHYIYGDSQKYYSILKSTLPANTIVQNNLNCAELSTTIRDSEAVLAYTNRMTNKNYTKHGRDLWGILKVMLLKRKQPLSIISKSYQQQKFAKQQKYIQLQYY